MDIPFVRLNLAGNEYTVQSTSSDRYYCRSPWGIPTSTTTATSGWQREFLIGEEWRFSPFENDMCSRKSKKFKIAKGQEFNNLFDT